MEALEFLLLILRGHSVS